MVTVKDTNNQKKVAALLDDLLLLEGYARDLFDFSPLPICFVSPMGVILEINPAFERISGYSVYEIVGQPIENLFEAEKFEELFKEMVEQGFSGGRGIDFYVKRGEKIPVSAFVQSRKDKEGEFVGYFLGVFDLTAFKKTESSLKETRIALLNMLEDIDGARRMAEEEKNKTLAVITNFADGLLVFDKENKLFLVNPCAEKLLGIKIEDVAGRSIAELNLLPQLQSLIGLLQEPRQEGETSAGEVKKLFREEFQPEERLVLEVTTIFMAIGQEKAGVLAILHDITREKIIERLKTEFVSLAAHQLRTPLSAIKWALRMLLDGDLGRVSKEQEDFIEKAYRSNERMIALVNDLLDITRIEEGRYIYELVSARLEDIVQSVIGSYHEEIEKRNLKLEFKKPDSELPSLVLDVEKMKLAIQNLVDNALRYTLPGGKVTITLKYDRKKIEFQIQDSGVGIPLDQQERVFSKFFRGANVMRMETEGSGLGLFIARNIIEAHGGKIWFESEENKGTTFYFTLPLKSKGRLEEFAGFLKEF